MSDALILYGRFLGREYSDLSNIEKTNLWSEIYNDYVYGSYTYKKLYDKYGLSIYLLQKNISKISKGLDKMQINSSLKRIQMIEDVRERKREVLEEIEDLKFEREKAKIKDENGNWTGKYEDKFISDFKHGTSAKLRKIYNELVTQEATLEKLVGASGNDEESKMLILQQVNQKMQIINNQLGIKKPE